jgi:superfamily I DNA/RNA helicase
MLLASSDPGETRWEHALPLPGKLFIVGDPKQSIYRFRRADIDIYNQVRARMEAEGAVLSLTANFRSLPGICDFANRVFPARFPTVSRPEAPKFEKLEPVRPPPVTGSPAIMRLTLPDGTSPKEAPGIEAGCIAAWIRSEVAAGRRRYGDVLVLTRNRPRLTVYADVLEAARIPVEVSGAGMFGGSEDVATLRGLLEALADPLDGVALVGLLRGALFGISDADLYRFREAGGRFDLTMPLPEPDAATGSTSLDSRRCARSGRCSAVHGGCHSGARWKPFSKTRVFLHWPAPLPVARRPEICCRPSIACGRWPKPEADWPMPPKFSQTVRASRATSKRFRSSRAAAMSCA